jgi:hypothetical protein
MKTIKILLLLLPLFGNAQQFYTIKTKTGIDSIVSIPKQYRQPILDSKSLFITSGVCVGMSSLGYYLSGDPFYFNLSKLALITSGLGLIRLIEERDTFSVNRLIRFDKPTKNDYVRFTAIFFSGACDGLRERSKFYPESLPDYMNPANTWQNKWKNGDPLQGEAYPMSSGLLSGGTDIYHSLGTARTGLNAVYTICFSIRLWERKYSKRELTFKIASEVLTSFVFYNLGKTVAMKIGR